MSFIYGSSVHHRASVAVLEFAALVRTGALRVEGLLGRLDLCDRHLSVQGNGPVVVTKTL